MASIPDVLGVAPGIAILAGIVVILTGGGTFAAWVVRRARRSGQKGAEREAQLLKIHETIQTIEQRMGQEFGGNSGGIRQEINGLARAQGETQKDVREIRARLDRMVDREVFG